MNGKPKHRRGNPDSPVGYHNPNDIPKENNDKLVAQIWANEGYVNEEADEDFKDKEYYCVKGEKET